MAPRIVLLALVLPSALEAAPSLRRGAAAEEAAATAPAASRGLKENSHYAMRLAHNFPRHPDYGACAVDADADDEKTLEKMGYFAEARKKATEKYGPGANWFQNFWEPCVGCANYKRVGPRGDGGKWLCDPDVLLEKPSCRVLSVGSNNDFSYEEAIVRDFGCLVHVYDYTSDPPKDDLGGRIKFFRVGLAAADGGRFLTLRSMLDRLSADAADRTVELVKVDCDGCEIAALVDHADAAAVLKERVLELNLEVHFRYPTIGTDRTDRGDARKRAARMKRVWARFHEDADMVPFSKEANIQYSRGDSVEYSFANKKLIVPDSLE